MTLHMMLESHCRGKRVFGDAGISLLVARAIVGDVGVSLGVAFADVGMSLFVASALFGDVGKIS